MIPATFLALLSAALSIAAPVYKRDVVLDPVATAQAQQRDNTATRAFSAAQIQTAGGQCLAIDPNSGDDRENDIPIQVLPCNGSDTQQWDIITSGVHDNVPGFALVVSTLTNGCMNFNSITGVVNLFSCGGRADGSGAVSTSQLFLYDVSQGGGPLPLVPQNGNNATCMTVNGALLVPTSCTASAASGNELFTISAQNQTGSSSDSSATAVSSSVVSTSSSSSATATSSSVDVVSEADCSGATTTVVSTVTVTAGATSSSAESESESSSTSATSTAVEVVTTGSPTVTTAISTGTVVLNPSAVAQAQVRDNTATRAFSAAQIKTSDGQCLFVDPLSGDFRENLTPVTAQPCDGTENQQWDVITSGVHDNVNGTALIVSTLTEACLNFDPRRAAGDQVILFSCGGRADGSGAVATSQLFTFAGNSTSIPLIPSNQADTCLVINSENTLDVTSCNTASPAANEIFTIVP